MNFYGNWYLVCGNNRIRDKLLFTDNFELYLVSKKYLEICKEVRIKGLCNYNGGMGKGNDQKYQIFFVKFNRSSKVVIFGSRGYGNLEPRHIKRRDSHIISLISPTN